MLIFRSYLLVSFFHFADFFILDNDTARRLDALLETQNAILQIMAPKDERVNRAGNQLTINDYLAFEIFNIPEHNMLNSSLFKDKLLRRKVQKWVIEFNHNISNNKLSLSNDDTLTEVNEEQLVQPLPEELLQNLMNLIFDDPLIEVQNNRAHGPVENSHYRITGGKPDHAVVYVQALEP
jgi:hypothetical protein